jgi:uncharacterized protein
VNSSATFYPWQFLAIGLVSFVAAFLDAIAGGGGLVQLPGLLVLFPRVPFPALSGTNKFSSFTGTLFAFRRYRTNVPLSVRGLLGPLCLAFLGSFIGALFVSRVDQKMVKPIVAGLLILVWLFTLFKKGPVDTTHSKSDQIELLTKPSLVILVFSFGIGAYDGLIGPGTGMFFLYGLVYLVGLDFLVSSAAAKLLNLATNLSALLFFWSQGVIQWPLVAVMAPMQIAGGTLGARLALAKGTAFVRIVSLVVTGGLIGKLLYDALFG